MPWPTPAPALLCAVLGALATAALTPAVLRSLPEPADPDGKVPYASLSTSRFQVTVGLAALLANLVVVATLPWQHWVAWAALTTVSVIACTIDAHTTWLPLPLARAGWALAAMGVLVVAVTSASWTPALGAAAGALTLGGLFHLLWRLTGAFGYGDVRLAATIGAVTALDSVSLVMWSLLLGSAAGAAVGVAHRLIGGRGAFPYGPGLLAGPFLAIGGRAALTAVGISWPTTG